ncbi:MAG TPA: hypothetical protein VFA79_20510, partial [Myxococcales bacterium]|nr:hypothetical protein [Myxococcales bacterium]
NGESRVTDDSAASAALRLLEGRGPLEPGAPELTSGYGELRAAVERDAGSIAYLCGGTLDGCKRLLADQLGAVVRLDDSAGPRGDAQAFRAPWRAFLAALNLFQHLPNASFATTELIETYGSVDLKKPFLDLGKDKRGEVAESAEPAGRAALSDEANAFLELVSDAYLESALRGMLLRGARLPEAGFELTDSGGRVVGEAEVAWPDVRVAILLPVQIADSKEFERAGWHVFPSEQLIADVEPVWSLLRGAKGSERADGRHFG